MNFEICQVFFTIQHRIGNKSISIKLLFYCQSDHCFPPVTGKINRDVCKLSRNHPANPLMGSDIVVIRLHPSDELLCSNWVIERPYYLCPLPEGSIESFEDVVVRLGFKVFQSHMWILDSSESARIKSITLKPEKWDHEGLIRQAVGQKCKLIVCFLRIQPLWSCIQQTRSG